MYSSISYYSETLFNTQMMQINGMLHVYIVNLTNKNICEN